MAISITMSIARKNDEPNSNITYFYDNCDIERFGIGGKFVDEDGGVGVGIMMQRIIDAKMLDFAKIIDPAITHRLQRAFLQKKKFRKLGLHVHEHIKHSTTYSVEFEDITVVSLKQQFEPKIYGVPFLMDIVSIQAGFAEQR
jgi:hypothetical protein